MTFAYCYTRGARPAEGVYNRNKQHLSKLFLVENIHTVLFFLDLTIVPRLQIHLLESFKRLTINLG